MSEHERREQEANELVRQFLAELEACKTEEQRIAKVWELIGGIVKSVRVSWEGAS
jgi:hypothetical protein